MLYWARWCVGASGSAGIVREDLRDLAGVVEEEHLGDELVVDAGEVEDDAVHAEQRVHEAESQVRVLLQRAGEVVAKLLTALQNATARQLRCERRGELRVFGVEVEDAVEVVRVPDGAVLLGEGFGFGGRHGISSAASHRSGDIRMLHRVWRVGLRAACAGGREFGGAGGWGDAGAAVLEEHGAPG